MHLFVKPQFPKQYFGFYLRKFATAVDSVTIGSLTEETIIDESDEKLRKEAEIEKKRNISRLNPPHFNIVHNRKPYDEPKCYIHNTLKYHRKMYGKFGSTSGVDPSICWPSKDQIAEIKEYESIAYPFTIREMIESAAKKRREEKLAIEARERDVAKKFAKSEQWKKELINKLIKKEQEAKAIKEKKERLVEEVRRHFGFKLDPRDEKFQEMLAKREKEQKKLEKQARKDAKEKMMLLKLQQQSAEIKTN